MIIEITLERTANFLHKRNPKGSEKLLRVTCVFGQNTMVCVFEGVVKQQIFFRGN
jgi:hypothetical protein